MEELFYVLLYFALWIILTVRSLQICLFGIRWRQSCLLLPVNSWTTASPARDRYSVFPLIHYIFVLVKEIIKANFAVIHMILSEKEEPEPALVHFTADMQTRTGRALLANAITLTTGTITVTLQDADYVVHCLDESLAVGMDHSIFVELLEDLERPEREGGKKHEQ